MDTDALIERLGSVVAQVANLTDSWWRMQADEVRTKSEAYISSSGESVAAKQRDVELATYHISASVLETRAELEALREERNFLLLLIGRK